MGGDFAPDEIVLGAAAVASPSLNVILAGQPAEIERCLATADPASRATCCASSTRLEVIGFDEDPVKAVRTKTAPRWSWPAAR